MEAFAIELLVELIVGGLVMLVILLRQSIFLKKIRKTKEAVRLSTLNASNSDKVLLIDNVNDIVTHNAAYNSSDIVLMKDEGGLYNIVMKNKYGSEGLIK